MKRIFFYFLVVISLFSPFWAFAEQLRLLSLDQEALQARVTLLQQARSEILVESFSVWNDSESVAGLALLVNAAKQGLDVKILLDPVPSKIPEALFAAAVAEGHDREGRQRLQFKYYNPVGFDLSKATFRTHSKMIIVDGKTLLTGDRNIGNSYFGLNPTLNFRSLDVLIKGPVAEVARTNFMQVWNSGITQDPGLVSQYRRRLDPQYCTTEEDFSSCETRQKVLLREVQFQKVRLQEHLSRVPHIEKEWFNSSFKSRSVQFLSHKPDTLVHPETAVMNEELLKVLNSAKRDVYIVSPYLIPGPRLLQAFQNAKLRGVRVRVITNSLKATDTIEAQAGYLYLKSKLIAVGLEIYEYLGPDTLHTKAAIFDNNIVFIGSYNIDPRSALLNREVGVLVKDGASSGFSKATEEIFEQYRHRSILVVKDGREYNSELQDQGVPASKRRKLDLYMLIVPLILNQL